MRGSKLKFKLAIIVLVLGICVAGFLPTLKTNKITQVGAENVSLYETPYCSQQYNDDIIFSVEQVYFADNRSTEFFYDTTTSSTLTNILGADGENNYFANFGGTENYVSKKVIYNNQFVLLDKTNSMNAYTEGKDKVTLKQGVMVTLGGYIFNQNQVLTNSQKIDENNYYSSRLTNLHIDMFRNGKLINNEAGLRTYYQNATEFFDFVYFIEADGSKEGYYTFDISYTIQGGDKVSHTFSFYALLSDNYVNEIEVNGVEYSPYPNITNANSNGTSYHSTTYAEQYPVLTYDYKRYNMKFAYVVNDSTTNVSVEYDEDENQLKVLSETNGIKDKNPLSYQCQSSNSLVSFVFASMGSYSFEFNYVYYYDDKRLVINNID
ncbi:MAG: hypothetical protein IJX26_04580, partial [Clostridia bacterium]|nr:hypothetical protein [Clostridia bacterium]